MSCQVADQSLRLYHRMSHLLSNTTKCDANLATAYWNLVKTLQNRGIDNWWKKQFCYKNFVKVCTGINLSFGSYTTSQYQPLFLYRTLISCAWVSITFQQWVLEILRILSNATPYMTLMHEFLLFRALTLSFLCRARSEQCSAYWMGAGFRLGSRWARL